MKATLTFDLPDDKKQFEVATHAMEWYLVAWDLDEKLREICKYGRGGSDSEEAETVSEILYDILDGYNLSFE